MLHQPLSKCRVAILATDGFEQRELFEPLHSLQQAGADVRLVSIQSGSITGWNKSDWGDNITVDATIAEVSVDDFDALVLPGGLLSPDTLRQNKKAVEFIRSFFNGNSQKIVAAICHAPWLLAEADVLRGRRVTSYRSIRTDLKNAGAKWVDEKVVVDKCLITSRKPSDLAAFIDKLIDQIEAAKKQPDAT